MTDLSRIVAETLDGWKNGIDEQRPADVATFFTEDALFQGALPAHSIGRQGVEDYYSRPHAAGLHVDYVVREIRPLADGVLSAYVDPTFSRPDGSVLHYHLTVILKRIDERWLISHYHAALAA
ncbi:SgcJ/EcaC family oxidoreductase [Actinoplanes sp. NPDC026670]|uniref:YybH family protein n=1 Tax=Actinoplanes sp. NPDC026670 TaxID=3154700 RepID=UPI0033C788FD